MQLDEILTKFMPSIFPSQLEVFYRLFRYIQQVDGGMDRLSEHLRTVIINDGKRTFEEYRKKFISLDKKKKVLWEYVQVFAHNSYSLKQVMCMILSFFRPSMIILINVPLFSSLSTPQSLQSRSWVLLLTSQFQWELLDIWTIWFAWMSLLHRLVTPRTFGSSYSTRVSELIFLYSNISNKVLLDYLLLY